MYRKGSQKFTEIGEKMKTMFNNGMKVMDICKSLGYSSPSVFYHYTREMNLKVLSKEGCIKCLKSIQKEVLGQNRKEKIIKLLSEILG